MPLLRTVPALSPIKGRRPENARKRDSTLLSAHNPGIFYTVARGVWARQVEFVSGAEISLRSQVWPSVLRVETVFVFPVFGAAFRGTPCPFAGI